MYKSQHSLPCRSLSHERGYNHYDIRCKGPDIKNNHPFHKKGPTEILTWEVRVGAWYTTTPPCCFSM